MRNTLLLESDTSGTCKRTAIKKILLVDKKQKRNFFTYLELYTKQFYLVHTYLSQKLTLSILTVASLWYFSSCFLLILLGDCHPASFSKEIVVTSLYFDLVTCEVSVSPKSAMFFINTSFQSCCRYSIYFLLSFFFVLALAIFLTF